MANPAHRKAFLNSLANLMDDYNVVSLDAEEGDHGDYPYIEVDFGGGEFITFGTQNIDTIDIRAAAEKIKDKG